MKLDRHGVAAALEEIAALLELQATNAFKVRAYTNGARVLEQMSDTAFAGHVDAGDFDTLDGVGGALNTKIVALARDGALPLLDKLREEVPAGLVAMLDIPDFGPKSIVKVHRELGVETIDDLRAAAGDGRIEALKGFGKKSAQKLLQGIEHREAYLRRHLRAAVAPVAEPICEGLRGLPEVEQAAVAGSYRRGMETVGDLDFLVAAEDPGPVMDWFVALPDIEVVQARGETKSSIRLAGGLQADLRVVPPHQFPFALHHFTGSKDHNVALRARALKRGYSLSEWGLFEKDSREEDDGVPLRERTLAPIAEGVTSEAGLFEVLGLACIPPELREGRGEIEAAEGGELPRLIALEDLRGAFHNHTQASDGRNSLEEMAAAAAALGWSYLGIADHSQSAWQANGLDAARLREQVEAIRAYNDRAQRQLRLFAGCEVDILRDGSLDFGREVLDGLDYCVLSVHSPLQGLSEAAMTERIVRALETPLGIPKMLGHATGRILLRREPYAVDLEAVLQAAARHNVVVELNANPYRLDLDWRWWPRARELGVLCAINPDAHTAQGLEHVSAGVLAARKGWLRAQDVLNTRDLPAVEQWMRV